MRVSDVMRRHPRVARGDDTLASAGTTMAMVDCGVLPVVDGHDIVVGVVTDRDICLALTRENRPASGMKVADLSNRGVLTTGPNDSIASALATMRRHHVRRLPVVDADGRIEGILSLDDIALEARELISNQVGRPGYAEIAETLAAVNSHHLLTAGYG